jgi:molybdate transport system substrate-binding protein
MKTLLLPLLLLLAQATCADTLRVAVAANFASAARALAASFEADSGHRLKLAFGSTGKHYSQIQHGAPFDAFFAADVERPRLLEAEGLAVPGSRHTYAIGRLVLWSPRPHLVVEHGQVLKDGNFDHLAIANPRLAPYGRAARQVLERLGLWQTLQGRLVRGENIGQTYHFVRGGGAQLGFVALSQLQQPGTPGSGSRWLPPADFYDPIEQQAVLLHDTPAGQALFDFLRSPAGRAIIRDHGYHTP